MIVAFASPPTASNSSPDSMAAEFLDAAVKGDLNKMQQLVQRGTKLDVRGTYGEAAFHCAAGRGHLKVVEWLMAENPALAQLSDMNNKVAIHYAARNNSLPMIQLLVGLTPQSVAQNDYKGRSPYDIARSVHGSNGAVARFLAENQYTTAAAQSPENNIPAKKLGRKTSFTVLDQSQVAARQEELMELVSGMLSISKDSAFAVLYKHSWNPELVANEAGRLGVPALMTKLGMAHEGVIEAGTECAICYCDEGTHGAGCGQDASGGEYAKKKEARKRL